MFGKGSNHRSKFLMNMQAVTIRNADLEAVRFKLAKHKKLRRSVEVDYAKLEKKMAKELKSEKTGIMQDLLTMADDYSPCPNQLIYGKSPIASPGGQRRSAVEFVVY